MYMLCRNRVADYATWKRVFDEGADAQQEAGLELRRLWRDVDHPDQVWFLFEIESLEKARAFISTPEAAATGERAGALDGEVFFVRDAWDD